MPVTSADVAKAAGVSRATVSAVINGSRTVSPAVKARVTTAMATLNYQPNELARKLREKRTYRVGLIISNSASPYWALIIKGVQQALTAAGYNIIFCDSDESPPRELANLRMLQGERVDGILVAPSGTANAEVIRRISTQLPVVTVDRQIPEAALDSVDSDNESGGYLATRHLLDHGYRRIACLTIRTDTTSGVSRFAGYVRALEEAGIGTDSDLIHHGVYTFESGYQASLDLLRRDRRPDAIFACSHLQAVGVLRAVSELGLSVPEDVALVGYDDMPWAPCLNPPLTVVAQPILEMGDAAGRLLLRRMEEGANESGIRTREQVIYPVRLIARGSCGCPAARPEKGL